MGPGRYALLSICLAAGPLALGAEPAGDRSWKSYELQRSYARASLRFSIRCPRTWKLKESPTSALWTDPKRQGAAFAVHWLNPDNIYDVESICRAGMCADLEPAAAAYGRKLRVAQPTSERRAAMGLAEGFLYAEAADSQSRISVWFTTDHLPVATFRRVLSTFDAGTPAVPYTACGCGCCSGVKPLERCLDRSKADELQDIIARDRMHKQSPDCAMMGCSRGIRYKPCGD